MQRYYSSAVTPPLRQFFVKKILNAVLLCPDAEGNKTHMIAPDISPVKIFYSFAGKLSAQKTKRNSLFTGTQRDAAIPAVCRSARLIRYTTGTGIFLFQMPGTDGTDHPADRKPIHFRGK